MPIRINLKELFGSDSQGVTVEKLNFNFNRLLELGIGDQGIQGIQGPAGSAGPSGLTGPAGTRGSLWYAASGDPNSPLYSPSGLLANDLYVDGSTGNQYQWDGATWNLETDLGSIIAAQISTASSIAFVRDLKITDTQQRYLTFKNRNDVGSDIIGGASTNDILFLNNFDESGIIETSTDLYTALARINADVVSSGGTPQRYHVQLGSYFTDTYDEYGQGAGASVMSKTKHDLKFRHVIDTLAGSPSNPTANGYIYIGKLSTSISETDPIIDLDYNSMFELISAKWDGTTGSELKTRIGSKEALEEYYSGTVVNGISFNLNTINSAIGLATNYQNNLIDFFNSKNYLFLEADSSVDAVYVNNELVQDGGNIIQAGTSEARVLSSAISAPGNVAADPTQMYGNAGIFKIGSNVLTVDGSSASSPLTSIGGLDMYGRLSIFDVTDPNNVDLTAWKIGTGFNTEFNGIGASDIKVSGNDIYVVSNNFEFDYSSAGGAVLPSLQVFSYNELTSSLSSPARIIDTLTRKSVLKFDPSSPYAGAVDRYHRIEIVGNKAIVSQQSIRSWGVDPVSSIANSMYGGASGSVFVLFDLSEKSDYLWPKHTASFSGVFANRYAHILDFKVREEYVYGLAINFADEGSNELSHTVKVLRANFKKDFDSSYHGVSSNIYDSGVTTANSSTHMDGRINKFGAIAINGKYVYAMYRNQLHAYDVETNDYQFDQAATGTPFIEVSSKTFDASSDIKSLDAQVCGNSMYLLYSRGASAYTTNESGIIKFDLRDPSDPQKVWTKVLPIDNASRMLIDGNHIYVSTSGSPTDAYLYSLEIDGIVSDHISTGSIESNKITSNNIQSPIINADVANVNDINVDTFSANGVKFNGEADEIQLWIGKDSLTGGGSSDFVSLGLPGKQSSNPLASYFYTDRLSVEPGIGLKTGNTNAVRIESPGGAPLAIITGNDWTGTGTNFVEWAYRDSINNAFRTALIGNLDEGSREFGQETNFAIKAEYGQSILLTASDTDRGVQMVNQGFSATYTDIVVQDPGTGDIAYLDEDFPSSKAFNTAPAFSNSIDIDTIYYDRIVTVVPQNVTDTNWQMELKVNIGSSSSDPTNWPTLGLSYRGSVSAIVPAGKQWTAAVHSGGIGNTYTIYVQKLGR